MGKNRSKQGNDDRSARQKAAQMRQEHERAAKRRERTVRLIGGGAVVALVVLIIGGAVLVPKLTESETPGFVPEADFSAAGPQGTFPADSPYAFGVPYGTASEGAPVLEIWEDFQCPACQGVENANGDGIAKVAEEGKVQLVWRPTTFLDDKLSNTASMDATAAWGCAIDSGRTREFHDVVYANPPAVEGAGWTPEEIVSFGPQAGLEGEDLEEFTTCVQEGKYKTWAVNSTKIFRDQEVSGTPTALLNGSKLENSVLVDQAALEQAIAAATGQ